MSGFGAVHPKANFQRVADGRGCEEVGIRKLDYFFNNLSWQGKKGREEDEDQGNFKLEERYLFKMYKPWVCSWTHR